MCMESFLLHTIHCVTQTCSTCLDELKYFPYLEISGYIMTSNCSEMHRNHIASDKSTLLSLYCASETVVQKEWHSKV